MPAHLLQPEQATARAVRRYEREHTRWLGCADAAAPWPLLLPLGLPNEREVTAEPEAVRRWAQAWSAWPGPGEVVWETRAWARLGVQRLPAALSLPSPEALADLAGQGGRWRRALARHAQLLQACPALRETPVGQRLFDALADQADADFERLLALLCWVAVHPASGLTLRQLPVPGLDTKWVEQRRGLVVDLLTARAGASADADAISPAASTVALSNVRDLTSLLGLARPPHRLRLRLLCPQLQQSLGGLSDIEAPVAELAALPIAPRRAVVVENLESGLALPPLPGAVALMKLGHAVGLLGALPWLRDADVVYWGDIDTHGYVMLDRARRLLPQTVSMLMDRQTLLGHRTLWGEEAQPHAGTDLATLTPAEREVHQGLLTGTWGVRVRLEQERLPWGWVLAALEKYSGPAAGGVS